MFFWTGIDLNCAGIASAIVVESRWMTRQKILDDIVDLTKHYKEVDRMILFGSWAREDQNRSSDIDIAVIDHNWSGEDINMLRNILNEQAKTLAHIDVLNYYQLKNDRLKQNILEEGIILYELGG